MHKYKAITKERKELKHAPVIKKQKQDYKTNNKFIQLLYKKEG